ncbi:hypothetical protein JCM10450v2_003728 [Rhodotorula kratochvilovae]
MSLPILVVNPNTTESMTRGVERALAAIVVSSKFPSPTFFTAPTGVPSINDDHDCHHTAGVVLPHLVATPYAAPTPTSPSLPSSNSHLSLAAAHSAVLIACYSVHPLVSLLAAHYASLPGPARPVLGIFEASLLTSLALLHAPEDRFGIVTTGAVWEGILSAGVHDFLGVRGEDAQVERFAGVETTGLSAVELHDLPAAEVEQRMKDAVKRLIARARGDDGKGRLRAVCLGCAGMAGLEATVRAACVEELGEEEGAKVHIVDGVKAGYTILEGMVRAQL